MPQQASAGLIDHTDEELALLTLFMQAGVEFREEKMRRLDELIAIRAGEGGGS